MNKNSSCPAPTLPKFAHISLLAQTPKPLVRVLAACLNEKQTFRRDKPFPYFLKLTVTFCFHSSRYFILFTLEMRN